MLKAMILFYPGCGGSMLNRVLSLTDLAIMGTDGENPQEHVTKVSAEEKLLRYLNWGGYGEDWKIYERRGRYSWKTGKNDFVNYEMSPLWLIDRVHAPEFINLEQQGLWEPDNTFEHFIFISITEQDKKFVERQEQSKNYSMDYDIQYPLLLQLEQRFADRSMHIPFASFFDQTQFVDEIKKIDQRIGLALNYDYVIQIWKKWLEHSQAVWKL